MTVEWAWAGGLRSQPPQEGQLSPVVLVSTASAQPQTPQWWGKLGVRELGLSPSFFLQNLIV